jgi:hypothetical protein
VYSAKKTPFPRNGGGTVIFQRREFIKNTVDMMLTKDDEDCFLSYYWRAPRGSGKTVFLKLVGKELEARDCDVYYFSTAAKLSSYSEGIFSQCAEKAGEKTVALLIDEVPELPHSIHWVDLLKSPPENLLVVGVGVPGDTSISGNFEKSFPDQGVFPMFLNENDLPEILSFFKIRYPHIDESIVGSVCGAVLNYTGGHLYPFVKFAVHLFDKNDETILNDPSFFFSSEEFQKSSTSSEVHNRCFKNISIAPLLTQAERILLGNAQSGDEVALERQSLYNPITNRFVSPLLISQLLQSIKSKSRDTPQKLLDDTEQIPYVEQIICAGLGEMVEDDFLDALSRKVAVEDAISFRWGTKVLKSLSNVWLSAQARMEKGGLMNPGAQPRIDFIFNGKLNLGIEVALNQSKKGVQEHLSRFVDKYKKLQDRGYVFHIDTKRSVVVTKSDKVYTFLKKENALYRGTSLCKRGAAPKIRTPPERQFSTLAYRCLRGVGKFF